MKTKIVAEIGINHNGDINIAKKLIDAACLAGCDYVKFQKRNPDVCVPEDMKDTIRETPWGIMNYLEYKHRMEFDKNEYDVIDKYCKSKNIKWFASVWDEDSIDFMSRYTHIMKIPSALITHDNLLYHARERSKYLMISTGMSDEEEIEHAVKMSNPDLIFHTNSAYPSPIEDLNLNYIEWLNEKYPDKEVGYSGHEFGLIPTYVAVVKGARWVERHITLERTMWGSDHMASVEPHGLIKLVKDIRSIEISMGTKSPRKVYDSEIEKRETLRG
tara:strand:- start:98 stop:916 length:819 start_codon:yes stop_codon:yes gene_type:complete